MSLQGSPGSSFHLHPSVPSTILQQSAEPISILAPPCRLSMRYWKRLLLRTTALSESHSKSYAAVSVPATVKSRNSGDRGEANLWIPGSLHLFLLRSTLLPSLSCRFLQKSIYYRVACTFLCHICYKECWNWLGGHTMS